MGSSRGAGGGHGGKRRPVRRVLRRVGAVIGVLALAYVAAFAWEHIPRPDPPPVAGNGAATTAARPWMVAIGEPQRYPDEPSHKGCVGTLIAPRAVVTAAHCIARRQPGELTVTGGRTDLRTHQGQTRTVARIWAAPDYVAANKRQSLLGGLTGPRSEAPDDIGLLVLTRALPYQPLPIAEGLAAHPASGTPARLYGWRMSPQDKPVLWQTPTTVVDDHTCIQRAHDTIVLTPAPILHGQTYDPASYLCAGIGDQKVTVRPSDSGSPLVIDGKLAGVTAWKPPGWDTSQPDYYTRAGSFRDQLMHQLHATTGGH